MHRCILLPYAGVYNNQAKGRAVYFCRDAINRVPTEIFDFSAFMERTVLYMTNEDTLRWLEHVADVLQENAAYLTQLDSAIGDADHGTNMARGFKAVRDKFPTMAAMDMAAQLKTVGTTLVSTVGGASGPLYGT